MIIVNNNTNLIEEYLLLIQKLEDNISSKAKEIKNYKYAFSVILPEDLYKELFDIYKKTSFYNFIEKFPWCHIKLLTETYVRSYERKWGRSQPRKILEEVLKVESINFWENIPYILKKLNLRIVREDGGPWYISSNILLHSGVPAAYFNDIYNIVKTSYKELNYDADRSINSLCNDDNIFKNMHFSKYFKSAFSLPTEKKMLLNWFVNLATVSYSPKSVTDLSNYLPPYLINCFQNISKVDEEDYRLNKQREYKRKISFESGMKFNSDKGLLEYLLISDDILNLKVENTCDDEIKTRESWQNELEKAQKRNSKNLILSIAPLDLLNGIIIDQKTKKIFDIDLNDNLEAVLFDSNLNVISPKQKEIRIYKENEAHLIIITKNECKKNKNIYNWYHPDDLSGNWWNWNHYVWEIEPMDKEFEVNFPEPYGDIKFEVRFEQSKINGSWISEFPLNSSDKEKHFGGNQPPSFRIESELFDQNTKPEIEAFFFNGDDAYTDYEGNLLFVNNNWIWVSSFSSEKISKQICLINIKIYNLLFGEGVPKDFFCFWYPSIDIKISPNQMLWAGDKCRVTVKGNDKLALGKNIITDLPDEFLEIQDNEYNWVYSKKPSNCLLAIKIIENKFENEFYLKLPYLSIWVQTEIENINRNKLEWTNKNPFERTFIEELVKIDYQARIKFRLFYKSDKILYLVDKQDNQNKKKILLEGDGIDSISCSELLRYNEPIIIDMETNVSYPLFKVNDKDISNWSFDYIYEKIKEKIIFNNKYYNPENR